VATKVSNSRDLLSFNFLLGVLTIPVAFLHTLISSFARAGQDYKSTNFAL
jgi:hypothetical protein